MASLPPPDRILPLAGVDELTPAHVMTMLRWRFFGQPSTRDYESRTLRYAALVGMHALAGAGPTELNRFETGHFDAEGRSVLLTFMETSRCVYVTPALLHVLLEWVEIRKTLVKRNGDCKSMFVGGGGKPLSLQTIDKGLSAIGEHLGAPRPLSAMLLDFFRATIARGSDPVAYRYVLGTIPSHVTNSTASLRDVRDLLASTDRIGEDLSFLADDRRAAELARDQGFPLCLDELLTPKGTRSLDPEHPLAIRLAAELQTRPEESNARAEHDLQVLTQNIAEIEPLLRSFDLSPAAASRMFGMATTAEFVGLRKKVLVAIGLKPERGPGRDVRTPMSREEQDKCAGILAESWPEDPVEQIDFRIDLLKREFPFAYGLMEVRKLYKEDAKRLFKVGDGQINSLVKAGDEGRLAEMLADLTGPKWTKSSSLQMPMTDAEKARLARIRSARWPDDPIFEIDFRIDLLTQEFRFVRGLILQRHIDERAARDLFKLTFGQIRALMDAGRESKLDKLLKDPPEIFLFEKGAYRPASGTQRERVERLAAQRWPDDPADWPAFRRRLLRREYPFIHAMVQTSRLIEANISQLFRLTRTQNLALRAASQQGRLWKLLNDDIWYPPWSTQVRVTKTWKFVWPRPYMGGRPKKVPPSDNDIAA